MERKIEEIFEFDDQWYQCIEGEGCGKCDLRNIICRRDISIFPFKACSSNFRRTDKKSVIFKKLEKIGKPYEHYEKLYQCYKLPMETEIRLLPDNCYSIGKNNLVEVEIKQNKEDMEEYKMYDAKEDILEFDKVVDECLFGEDKLKLKPFNLQKAREGKPVYTRDGREARVICFDRKFYHDGYNYPIVAMVDDNDNELVHAYTQDGLLVGNMEGELDLMMLPEKKEGWVNIYKSDNGTYYTGAIFYEKNDALVNTAEIEITTGIPRDCIDTVKVCWEE